MSASARTAGSVRKENADSASASPAEGTKYHFNAEYPKWRNTDQARATIAFGGKKAVVPVNCSLRLATPRDRGIPGVLILAYGSFPADSLGITDLANEPVEFRIMLQGTEQENAPKKK